MQVLGLSTDRHGHQKPDRQRKPAEHRFGGRAAIAALAMIAATSAYPGARTADAAAVEAQSLAPAASASGRFGPTAVGQKAAQLRADFEKLRANTEARSEQLATIRKQTIANVNAYHTLVGSIRSRLQMGSTPGNPELLANWSSAQTQLTQIDADIATLN